MADKTIRVITDKENIVPIADKVRVLDGTTIEKTLGEMVESIDEANAEIAIQAEKIAELSAILDTKATSGGVETCTVRITADAKTSIGGIYCITLVNGVPTLTPVGPQDYTPSGGVDYTIENVLLNTPLTCVADAVNGTYAYGDVAAQMGPVSDSYKIILPRATTDGTATISIVAD